MLPQIDSLSIPAINRRILTIDDSPDITRLLVHLLSRRGYDVQQLNDSRHALSTIVSTSSEVVLIDIDMPDFNGLEVLQHLREASLRVGVIVVTTDISEERAERAFRLGADFVYPKPLTDFGRLFQLVDLCFFRLDEWKRVLALSSPTARSSLELTPR